MPRQRGNEIRLGADAFDRRIVTWLAFGPIATVLALSALSGRGTVAMWGYPLWLFFGVWLVVIARGLNELRLGRMQFDADTVGAASMAADAEMCMRFAERRTNRSCATIDIAIVL